MAENTLDECINVPGERVELPTCPGIWIKREPEPDGDSIIPIDRDEDGELCFFWTPRRPVMDFDKGHWRGPLKLVPVELTSDERANYEAALAACCSASLWLVFCDMEDTAQFHRIRDVLQERKRIEETSVSAPA